MITNQFLNELPEQPGIYLMKNKNDKIIYVGKAKILKNRVKQYFVNSASHTPKVNAMVSNVDHIEYIVTSSETEALNLECSFIKKHKPKYNILLKDDKTYPYIKLTNESYPRVLMVRNKEKDSAKYFGPFTSTLAVKTLLDNIKKVFKIRDCSHNSLDNVKKACLNYHIKRCIAPCVNSCKQEYINNVEQASKILNGDFKTLIKHLQEEMQKASSMLNFEDAAEIRDRIYAIKKIEEQQLVVTDNNINEDYLALVKDDGVVCIQQLVVREGKLIDKHSWFMQNSSENTDTEIMNAFLIQYYIDVSIPKRIFTSVDTDEEIAIRLSEIKSKKVEIKKPLKGDKANYIKMAELNGLEAIKMKSLTNNKKNNNEAMVQLKELLNLDSVPKRIEAFDISNTNGMEAVASMVVYINGVAEKNQYRKFKVKYAGKSDDYGAMREVLYRRFKRYLSNEEKFNKKPDLIFVDGGKGQIKSAYEVLNELNIDISVFGIVKDDKHRTRDIISYDKAYNIPLGSKCFKLAANIQDEMHRVAISYHKKLRNDKNLRSGLLAISGVGENVCKILLKEFKTIERIKRASVDELAGVKGINKPTAQNIYNYFNN